MTRRSFLGACAAALDAYAAPAKPPNILFILPDQLRSQALGCMGNPDVRTPNIDRMAAEGLILPNTFANTPVCCPARANILTGTYASRNGMTANDLRLRESETSIADLLGRAGYRTGFIGKWHLDGGPRMPGFIPPGPRRHGFQFWAANECNHSHFNTQYFRDTPEPIAIHKFEAEAWTDIALDFMKASTQPYFLIVSMGPPHDPYKAPPEFASLYDPAKLHMRANWQEGKGLPGPKEISEYYGNVSAVDQQVGRLLAAADKDTIVLLSSDHGDMLGSEGRRLKRKPWEESICVPGIVRYPARVKAGSRSEAIFTHVDFKASRLCWGCVRGESSTFGYAGDRSVAGDCGRVRRGSGLRVFPDFWAVSGRWYGGWVARSADAALYVRPLRDEALGAVRPGEGSLRNAQSGGGSSVGEFTEGDGRPRQCVDEAHRRLVEE